MFEEKDLKIEEKIEMLQGCFSDILDAMNAIHKYDLYVETAENKFGGNPETAVYFKNATINGISYKDKQFVWQRAVQTEAAFLHEIMAYLFKILYGAACLS